MLAKTILNENSAQSYSSTGDARVDYFSMITRDSSKEMIQSTLEKSWKIDQLDTLKLIFHMRDCRGGNGEKDVFYHSMVWLWGNHSKTFLKNLQHIPEYGSYKDWCKLVEHDCGLRYVIGNEFAKQLKIDTKCSDIQSQSLCAKYAPSEKHEYDKKIPGFVNIIAKGFSDDRDYKKVYRKGLSKMRNNINIVEKQMCEQDWDNIDYSIVPSKASQIYKSAFRKHSPYMYELWLDSVSNGESKVNAKQMQPHELAGNYVSNYWGGCESKGEDQLTELQWVQLVKDGMDAGDFRNCIAMPDMSGSMSGMPMNVAATLSIMVAKIAEKQGSVFGNLVISFSESPNFIQLDNSDSLYANLKTLMNGGSDGLNTDLHKAFSMVIHKALENGVKQSEFPEKIIIFTDMQFDSATGMPEHTMVEYLDKLFENTPYKRPNIVCWNLRSTGNVAATSRTNGVALVSGFSKDTFKSIMNNDLNFTPHSIMRNAIDSHRYDRLKI